MGEFDGFRYDIGELLREIVNPYRIEKIRNKKTGDYYLLPLWHILDDDEVELAGCNSCKPKSMAADYCIFAYGVLDMLTSDEDEYLYFRTDDVLSSDFC